MHELGFVPYENVTVMIFGVCAMYGIPHDSLSLTIKHMSEFNDLHMSEFIL